MGRRCWKRPVEQDWSGLRGSNPVRCCFAVRRRSDGLPVTCDPYSPTVTAGAHRGPAVADAVRTQRGPSGGQDRAMPYACWILRTWAASAFAPVTLGLSVHAGRTVVRCHGSGLSGSCLGAVAGHKLLSCHASTNLVDRDILAGPGSAPRTERLKPLGGGRTMAELTARGPPARLRLVGPVWGSPLEPRRPRCDGRER